MKNKKQLFLLWALLLTCLVSAISIYAHPGRTDANGGHWDRKAGTYHFHTGEYAGKGSSGSSSPKEYEPFTTPYAPPTDNPYKQENRGETSDKSFSWGTVVAGIFAFLFFIAPFLFTLISLICEFVYNVLLKNLFPSYKINKFSEKLNILKEHQQKAADISKRLFYLKSNLHIPKKYSIGKDKLPKEKNCTSGWGKTFTLYKTINGTKLHTKYNCSFATQPVHIWKYQNHNPLSQILCKKCAYNYSFPDMSWYKNYTEYKETKKTKAHIEIYCEQLKKEVDILHRKCNSPINQILASFSYKNTVNLHTANKLYEELNHR